MKKTNKSRTKDKANSNQEQVIYERIFDVILEQHLAPGARLTEEALGEIFSVSRTIIRRVLLRLSHEGVVELKPNKGANVTETPIEMVDEFFVARKIIEGAIMRLATGKATQSQIDSLRNLTVLEQQYLDAGSRGKGLRTSSELHIEIAKIANNKSMTDFACQLISRTALIISQYQDQDGAPCGVHTQHDNLISMLESGDPAAAEQAMIEHIQHIQDSLNLEDTKKEPDLFAIFGDTQS